MSVVRKWAFTAGAAVATVTPYLPYIKPVLKTVSDGLEHQTTAQIVSGALLAGVVAYQAFKADPSKGSQDSKAAPALGKTMPQNTDAAPIMPQNVDANSQEAQ